MLKDEWGNIVCPKCKERKYKITSVSCVEDKPGIIKFQALCSCKKKFSYERPVSEIGVYHKPDKPVEPMKFPEKPEVKEEIKKRRARKPRSKKKRRGKG